MDTRPYQPRFTTRHPNQSPNISSTSSPASPIGYHRPSHHAPPYAAAAADLKHHRPAKSFSSRNTPPPTSASYPPPHAPAGMDERRYMHPSQPPPQSSHQPPPPPQLSRPPPPPMSNDKRPSYPGDRGPNAGWNESIDDRYHDPRNYRPHEQPQQQQHPPPHQGHQLHGPPPLPPHRDDRSAPPPFHRQNDNATPPLSEGPSSGRSMLNASPQMYRAEHPREREHPRDHPHSHPHPHPHPHPHSHHPPPPHYAQPGPPPPPPPQYSSGPSLQSTQQQHHQLQQQLQQGGPAQQPHHAGAPQSGPFAPQPLFSQPPPPQGPQHPPPPHHHHHQRSASYSEPQHPSQPPSQYHPSSHAPPLNRPASTSNRPMPPPSPPHYPRAAPGPPGPPPHQQGFPPPTSGTSFGGSGRDLPSISSLEIPREISRPTGMPLSSILGDAPSGPPVRLEHLTQTIFREPPRTLGPDLSPLKRPFTPGDRPPIGGHAIEATRSNSPPMNKPPPFPETRTPPFRPGPSLSRPRDGPPHFSPPSRPLSQPTYPQQQPEPQPQPQHHQHPQPPPPHAQHHPSPYHPQERLPEREQYSQQPPQPPPAPPHLRAQNHLRTSSYPESPYQRQIPEPPRREPTPPRQIQQPPPTRQTQPPPPQPPPPSSIPNVSPPASQQSQPQPQSSPSYHHPAPPTSSAASMSFNAYTTQMPESPFAITPGLSNQHAIPNLHQYGDDRKKQSGGLEEPAHILGDRQHELKPWETMERERSTDIPPLRAEEALVKGIHERKYPSAFVGDMVSQSPKLKREVIVIDEAEAMLKKDDDIEMTGVEMVTLSPHKRSEPQIERAAKRRKPYTPSSHLRSDSTLSNLDEPGSLVNTPTKPHGFAPITVPPTSNSHAASNLPTIPPPQVIDSSEVREELKKHERHHLGSMVYTLTNMKKSVKSYSQIPLFLDRENCTFIIRIPWYTLSTEERERVCSKRLLWGTEVYSDDSNVLAVLIHLGYLPGVRDGQEIVEYASAHDSVVAKLSAPKRRGATARQREIAAMMAEGLPKPAPKIPEKKDLLVKIVICGNLKRYSSSVRYGLKSRSWERHDGMSFMVEDVKWVEENYAGFADKRGVTGVHERLAKWQKMRTASDTAKVIPGPNEVMGGPAAVTVSGSQWLTKVGAEKSDGEKESSGAMQVDGEGEGPAPESKEKEKEKSDEKQDEKAALASAVTAKS
ncbi:hypothetical protein TWF696_000476 [Orbilia brochopaga]|uniref:Rxt3-domain-containing protein n=1 Tax=Orbilia brochopaga TaxID=3140254 RepID=A0AAV9VE24_9PEZI